MKAYVITILNNERSVQAADRCIKSAIKYGLEPIQFKAIIPSDSPMKIASDEHIPIEGFEEKYSRFTNCLSAFLSHYWLWKRCVELKEPIIILEHDAVFVNQLPPFFTGEIVNLGKPSYGKYKTPALLGENKLESKSYLPGAHAYYIEPRGAKKLIETAKLRAGPTDVFINLNNFPNIKEYYPWPVEARDGFTTIQNENGCLAKHNFNDKYEIL